MTLSIWSQFHGCVWSSPVETERHRKPPNQIREPFLAAVRESLNWCEFLMVFPGLSGKRAEKAFGFDGSPDPSQLFRLEHQHCGGNGWCLTRTMVEKNCRVNGLQVYTCVSFGVYACLVVALLGCFDWNHSVEGRIPR